MRISLYQLLFALIFATVSAAGTVGAQDILNQKITIQVSNLEMKTVLTKLNKLTQLRFTYSSSLIKSQRKVSIHAVDRPLGDILDDLFKSANITYKIEGRQVVLMKNAAEPGSALPEIIRNQSDIDRNITGRVTDEKGNPLPGVNIVVKGTKVGTTTDTEGTFQLSVPDGGGMLVFSSVGFTAQEIPLGNQSNYDISMTPDESGIVRMPLKSYIRLRK